MKRKLVIGAVIVVAMSFIALVYASPYITLRSIGKAVERQDAQAVSTYVDFHALRDSVKAEMLARMRPELDEARANNPFGNIGKMLATGVVNQLTDALVSPTGVMVMLKNGRPGKPADVAAAGVGVNTQEAPSRRGYAVDYQGWSQVFVHPKSENTGFIFRRDGLFSWKLSGLKLDGESAAAP